jgi:hypothetical protein
MRKFVEVPRGTFGSRILGTCGASIVWTLPPATKPSYAAGLKTLYFLSVMLDLVAL